MTSEIALTNRPNQTFTVTIPGDTQNVTLIITLTYNGMAGYWAMGIYDASDNPLILGIPLLSGYGLLDQHQHLNIGNATLVNIGAPTVEHPDYTNLEKFVLRWELM